MVNETMDAYLATSTYIDWETANVLAKARELATAGDVHQEAVARRCFEFVRDEIQHSVDYQRNPVTCKASDVLREGTGYCYAKSHLLAALLRANGIPAALCYQRLTISDDRPPFCLHGLNAIYLPDYGWYRVDPRGNKTNVDAQFVPPKEQLAFKLLTEGEMDLPGLYAEPLPEVIAILEKYTAWNAVLDDLPDSSFDDVS